MSLKTYAATLTSSDQEIFTVPVGIEGTAHSVLCTGTGDLTLKYVKASTGETIEIFSGKTVTDELALEKPFNFESGDSLVASGTGLKLFASVYLVGDNATSATLAYGPGPQTLIAGDMSAGYFGEVSSAELYSGERLSLELGVTEGVSQNSDAGWLKFAHNGKVKFIAKKSIRHSVSWDHIYSRGLVYGTNDGGKAPRGNPVNQYTTVKRAGNEFIVRLMTGADQDPFDDTDPKFYDWNMKDLDIGAGSEWNELMYRVHQDVPDADLPAEEPANSSDAGSDGQRLDRHGGPQQGSNWATMTNSELNIGTGNGRSSWCQEQSQTTSSNRVNRGVDDVAHFYRHNANNTYSFRGWRPVLELVPNN